MGPKILITVQIPFTMIPPGLNPYEFTRQCSRENVGKVCDYLLKNHPKVSYTVGRVAPSITAEAYEYTDDEIQKLLIELRSLEGVEVAERV